MVGRLVADLGNGYVELCSGTMVSRTIVLTAGDCLWNSDTNDYFSSVYFVPGQSWNGVVGDPAQIIAPYGVWPAARGHFWTTSGYANGDASADRGLVELGPDSSGRYVGDIVGSYEIHTSLNWAAGSTVYSVGYPSRGFWSTEAGFNSRAQYACSSTYDGQYSVINSGYELWVRCTMSPGSSGGPWFVAVGGRWVIGGVTNRCWLRENDDPVNYCSPNSNYTRASYMDSRFMDFWNNVQALLTWR